MFHFFLFLPPTLSSTILVLSQIHELYFVNYWCIAPWKMLFVYIWFEVWTWATPTDMLTWWRDISWDSTLVKNCRQLGKLRLGETVFPRKEDPNYPIPSGLPWILPAFLNSPNSPAYRCCYSQLAGPSHIIHHSR